MRTIAETPPAARFLLVSNRLSAAGWARECAAVEKGLSADAARFSDSERHAMLQILRRPLRDSEQPLVVLHCYADIPAGTHWNLAFDLNAPEKYEPTAATLQFGVIWQRMVVTTLSDGCHQVAVLDFPQGVPELLSSLPFDPAGDAGAGGQYVGLCTEYDLPNIQQGLRKQPQ